jgi:hypothetical protein
MLLSSTPCTGSEKVTTQLLSAATLLPGRRLVTVGGLLSTSTDLHGETDMTRLDASRALTRHSHVPSLRMLVGAHANALVVVFSLLKVEPALRRSNLYRDAPVVAAHVKRLPLD